MTTTTVLDSLIIGSGPAGLSAAIYVSRAGMSTAIVEGDTSGGLITTTEKIDNYLGLNGVYGMEMAENFKEHAVQFGAEILRGSVTEIIKDNETGIFSTTIVNELGKSTVLSKTVVFSAGSTPRKLGVFGEELSGVSYCATCDGMFFSDEPVVVVGGGETAAEEALYLSQLASSVHILVRGPEWRATAPAVAHLEKAENISISMSTSVAEIIGSDEVEAVRTTEGETIPAKGVFVAIGQEPNSKTAKNHTVLLEDGFIKSPNVLGFFVAGDICIPEYRQAIIAAGDGARAGIDATRYVLSIG